MGDAREDRMLAQRYDGPIPPLASITPALTPLQWAECNKAEAWGHVRRVARILLSEGRMLRETCSMTHYEEWKRQRIRLRRMLEVWAIWRDEVRAMDTYAVVNARGLPIHRQDRRES